MSRLPLKILLLSKKLLGVLKIKQDVWGLNFSLKLIVCNKSMWFTVEKCNQVKFIVSYSKCIPTSNKLINYLTAWLLSIELLTTHNDQLCIVRIYHTMFFMVHVTKVFRWDFVYTNAHLFVNKWSNYAYLCIN